MLRYTVTFLLVVFCSLLQCRAAAYDTWTTYFSMRNATQVVDAEGRFYALMSGNVVMYDVATAEVRPINRITEGLSDANVSFIGYSYTKHMLVILYADGNIDIYDEATGKVRNVPQFMDRPDDDFSVNNLFVCGNDAVISTNEGVIWMSVDEGVIYGRYAIGACSAGGICAGRIYACLKAYGVYSALLTDNLMDLSCWKHVAYALITDMHALDNALYCFSPATSQNVKFNLQGVSFFSPEAKNKILVNEEFDAFSGNANRLLAYRSGHVAEFLSGNTKQFTTFDLPDDYALVAPAGSSNTELWAASVDGGVLHAGRSADGGTFATDYTAIAPDGPFCDVPYYLNITGDRLYMTAGVTDPTDNRHNPYCASWLDADGRSTDLERPTKEGGWLSKHVTVFRDATSIVEDVFDPSHIFVTSGSHGVFEYRDERLVKQYTQGNSRIESCSGSKSHDFVRTDAGIMDKDGNLFVANNSVDTVIWCRKPDGVWIPFFHASVSKAGFFEKVIIDSKGRLWFANRRTDGNLRGGVLCIDYGQTVDNAADDVYTYRHSNFFNQDGTQFTYQAANALAQDRTGRIWLGTDRGLLVIDDPDTWTDNDFRITQVKVPRNDGTNYADYLLNGVYITSIAVDGADRKWVGTQDDGVYMVSSDGTEIYHHFTKKNSPLVSDNVSAVVCHPRSGEVFIATDAGLVSYQSDASEVEPSLAHDNLRVYPNPVRPDYSGPIVLDGLVYDTDVKVVSTGGQAVAAGTSHGGTFTWDGRGPNGQRVASGIYYFMAASPDGKEAVVAKVAVVR